ncbi:MAG: ribonuclease H-like domain-containing protein [Aridibacter sp.]
MGVLGWDKEAKSFHLDEKRTLESFWNLMRGFIINRDRLVGHNIFEFDLRFIVKRSIINGIRLTVNLSFRRYVNQSVFDTMREWECWSYDKIKLDTLADALSLPSSKTDSIDGSKLFDYFEDGRHKEIFEYCLLDVHLTRKIYRRMTFCKPDYLTDLSNVGTENINK